MRGYMLVDIQLVIRVYFLCVNFVTYNFDWWICAYLIKEIMAGIVVCGDYNCTYSQIIQYAILLCTLQSTLSKG